MQKKPKVALVLAGGIARGLSQVGVLKVIKKEKINIDLIVGSSIGSLIGALYAADIDIKEIERYATTTSLRDFFHLYDFLNPISGFFSGGRLMKRFNSYMGNRKFKDLKMKLMIPVIDLNKGEEIILEEGLVKNAVRAGISMPLFFKPVKYNEKLLIDGGILNHFPVDIARKYADIVIGVDIERDYPNKKNKKLIDILCCTYTLMRNKSKKLQYEQNKPDILIVPKIKKYKGRDLSKSREIVREGEKAAIEKIPEIKEFLKKNGVT